MPSPLSEIIRLKLRPWSQHNAAQRFIVGGEEMNSTQAATDVRLTRHKIRGKRVVVKNRRYYGNTRGVAALWPDIGLNEVHKLKLACTLNGHIDYQLGNYRLQCGPGHFIFIPPGLPHSDGSRPYVDTQKSTSCEVLFFLLHPNALQCWISRSQLNQNRKQEGNYLVLHERATLLFRALMEEVLTGEEQSLAIGEELLTAFLSILQREAEIGRLQPIRSNAPGDSQQKIVEDSTEADFATRLGHYLQANLHKPLTTESVSREMFLSRAQFVRVVRRETGSTFNELLAAYRIAEAQELLQSSQWTASAIAAFVGFKSPSYFRTFFRERTGSTPSEFRTAHAKSLKPKQ